MAKSELTSSRRDGELRAQIAEMAERLEELAKRHAAETGGRVRWRRLRRSAQRPSPRRSPKRRCWPSRRRSRRTSARGRTYGRYGC